MVKRKLIFILILITALAFQHCSKDEKKNKDYSIKVIPTLIKENVVQLEIITTIPGIIDVMAGVKLANQKPTDVFIGHTERVTIKNGKATVIVGENKNLPKGSYIAEVNLYPGWGLKNSKAKATGINKKITATASITLGGSISLSAQKKKNSGQVWVMENVWTGTKWDINFWIKKFGNPEQIKVTKYNPNIIKAYYFKTIDMTIIVNDYKKKIDTYRIGKQNY